MDAFFEYFIHLLSHLLLLLVFFKEQFLLAPLKILYTVVLIPFFYSHFFFLHFLYIHLHVSVDFPFFIFGLSILYSLPELLKRSNAFVSTKIHGEFAFPLCLFRILLLQRREQFNQKEKKDGGGREKGRKGERQISGGANNRIKHSSLSLHYHSFLNILKTLFLLAVGAQKECRSKTINILISNNQIKSSNMMNK